MPKASAVARAGGGVCSWTWGRTNSFAALTDMRANKTNERASQIIGGACFLLLLWLGGYICGGDVCGTTICQIECANKRKRKQKQKQATRASERNSNE